jgi:hypothetical protein
MRVAPFFDQIHFALTASSAIRLRALAEIQNVVENAAKGLTARLGHLQ